MVTANEIESKIVRLHEEGKTSKFIAAAVHKNFTYIGTVLKRNFPEEYTETDKGIITKETQALKLFSLRKTPTQAAIELNETPDSIEKYFEDYWHLQRMYSLYRIYRENRKAVPHLLRMHKLLEKKGIYPNLYDEVVDLIEKQIFSDDPTQRSIELSQMSQEQALKSDRYAEWLENAFP